MVIKIIFSIIAALLPVIVSNGMTILLERGESDVLTIALSGIVSLVFLVIIQLLLDRLDRKFDQLNKYCGHWVEEMTYYHGNEPTARMIGIGLIRYDKVTNEYVFDGKTYSLDGEEKYIWTIGYLHPERDGSMQYVCSVQIPGERSIGQITFYNEDESDGHIWIMNGDWYKLNAYRIKPDDICKLGIEPIAKATKWSWLYKRWLSYKGMVISQRDCPEFVRSYSEKKFPPLKGSPDNAEGRTT